MVLFFGYKREEPLQLIDPAVVPTVYDQVRALDSEPPVEEFFPTDSASRISS